MRNTPPPPAFRSTYFTITSEGTIEHKKVRCGPYTVFAPVKLRKAERGLQVDVNKAGSPPIPESYGGHYVFVLPGGEEYIDEKEAK